MTYVIDGGLYDNDEHRRKRADQLAEIFNVDLSEVHLISVSSKSVRFNMGIGRPPPCILFAAMK